MNIESRYRNEESESQRGHFAIRLTSPMLYDGIHVLSAEYSLPVESLADIAVKRLLDDVDFTRKLRAGRIEDI